MLYICIFRNKLDLNQAKCVSHNPDIEIHIPFGLDDVSTMCIAEIIAAFRQSFRNVRVLRE